MQIIKKFSNIQKGNQGSYIYQRQHTCMLYHIKRLIDYGPYSHKNQLYRLHYVIAIISIEQQYMFFLIHEK